jgi:uncharacterized protein (TIGR00369 family)
MVLFENMTAFKDIIEKWMKGETELAPVTKLLGIKPVSWEEGRARVEMRAGSAHHNALGTVHGGIFTDLADVAMGVAFASTLGVGESFATLELHTHYFVPVREGRLAAEARVMRRGSEVSYVECEIKDDAGRLVAKTASTCMILRKRP